MLPTKETAADVRIDRLSRKLVQLRQLSPSGYPWAKAEIAKIENELKILERKG